MIKNKLLAAKQVIFAALLNHIVMASVTSCSTIENIPNDLTPTYYEKPFQAGMIIEL